MKTLKRQRGITLVEMVLGVAGGAALALVMYMMIAPYNNALFTFWRRSGGMEAQAAMGRILGEVNRIKANTYISTYTSEHLAFVDVDDQGVDFQKTGTDILRNSDVLARNVQGLTFEYLDGDGLTASAPAEIKVIRVTLSVLTGNQTVTLQSAAGVCSEEAS